MLLTSEDIQRKQPIDSRFAFGRPDGQGAMELSENLSPQLTWHDAPPRTKSFALICVDPDVPSVADNVNREGVVLEEDLPRVDFYHWTMANIPPGVTSLARGECSQGVTLGGKPSPQGPAGSVQGINDYTHFMAGSEMAGAYRGYDGPCPPWNDARMHHYYFKVFALDVAELELPEDFSGQQLLAAMEGHVLAEATLMGTYTLYPPLMAAS